MLDPAVVLKGGKGVEKEGLSFLLDDCLCNLHVNRT